MRRVLDSRTVRAQSPTRVRQFDHSHFAQRQMLGAAVPTKKSILIEIVAFTESRPVAFPDHADRTFLSARLFPSSRCSASRDSCAPASASALAAFEPWA